MSRLASPVRVTLFGSSRPIWLVRFVRTIWASATPGKPISFEKLLCFASDWLISLFGDGVLGELITANEQATDDQCSGK